MGEEKKKGKIKGRKTGKTIYEKKRVEQYQEIIASDHFQFSGFFSERSSKK